MHRKPTKLDLTFFCATLLLSVTAHPLSAQTHNYSEALQKALFFYEVQTSGPLPLDHRVEWRGDSCTRDGADVGRDLTGGWYDAGDGVVWTGNEGFATSLLAWSLVKHRDVFIQTGQYQIAIDRVREISDYLEKIVQLDGSANVERIYCGKGAIKDAPPDNPAADNDRTEGCPNEVMDTVVGGAPQALRPSFWVDAVTGGADVAGATAAALAANSIALRDFGDTARADELLALAKKVFAWGQAHPNLPLTIGGTATSTATRRMTNGSPVTIADYANRISTWTQRMIYAAAWLHRADTAAATPGYTSAWVDVAETIYNSTENASKRAKHWVNFASGAEQNGAYTMLAADSGRSVFVTEANAYANFWLYDRSNHTGRTTDPTVTPEGFVCRGQGASWNVHALLDQGPPLLDWADSSFHTNATRKAHLDALFTGTYNNGNNECPVRQIDYILGSNTRKISYLQGYKPAGTGYDWVKNLHHRPTMWAYGGFGTPAADKPDWNRFTAYGTLCPGPDHTDFYPVTRTLRETTVYEYQEPIIYTGGIVTVLARNIAKGGPAAGAPLPTFPVWETRPSGYQTESFFVRATKDSATRFQCYLNNRAMFPPREIDTLGFRYYFTPDGVAGSAVTCSATGSGLLSGESVAVSGPYQVGSSSTWCFEIRLVNAMIVPGEYKRHQRKVQLDFSQPSGTFNPANDHSGAAITSTEATIDNLPVYDTAGGTGNWKLLGGFEPSAGYIQWRRAHFNNSMESASGVTLIAERVGGKSGAVTAAVNTTTGTAGSSDFTAPAGAVLSWTDGEAGEKTITISLLSDSYAEGREYFNANLGGYTGGASAGITTSARVSIEDDDHGSALDPNALVQILGNNSIIAPGDTTPSVTDHTHFGSAETSLPEAAITRVFTIRNRSSEDTLTLTGNPRVLPGGSAAGDFTVLTQPPATIAPGGSATFEIRFAPTANGNRNASLSVPYSLAASDIYQFSIAGTGVGATPAVTVSPGGVTANVAPGGSSQTVPVTLQNSGRADLTWNASLPTNYTAVTSTDSDGPAYNWIDITTAGETQGTIVTSWGASSTNRDDGITSALNIGFNFPFYGSNRTQIKVSINGLLTFDASANGFYFNNFTIPSTSIPAPTVCAWWDDLYLKASQGDVYHKRVDADTYVVTWHRVSYFNANNPTGDLSFQVVLKRDGRIIYQYKNVIAPLDTTGYTIGIQNSQSESAQAVQYAYNTKTADNGIAIEFRPPVTGAYDPAGNAGNWAAISASSGTVPALSSGSFNLALNTTGLISGQRYQSRLTLTTNDPSHPSIFIPLTLTATRTYNLASAGAANRAWETNSNWSPNSTYPGPHDELFLTTAGGSLRIDGPRSAGALTLDFTDGLTLIGTGFGGSGSNATLTTSGLLTVKQGALLAGGSGARLRLDGGLRLEGGSLGFAAGATGSITMADNAPITLLAGTLDAVVNTSGTIYRMAFGSGDMNLDGISPEIRVATDAITLSRRFTGSGGFRKTGAGTLILAGANANHGGTTELAEGTLRLAANSALGGDSTMKLSGGTLHMNGRTLSVGKLQLAGNAIIDFSGGGTLVFADSSSETWSADSLTIINFTPGADSLRVGTSAAGLAAGQLARITINGQSAIISSNGLLGLDSFYAWNTDASGNWNVPANWDPDIGFPNNINAYATFGPVITAARSVTLNQSVTIGTLNFNEDTVGANAYTISFSSAPTFVFDVNSGQAALNARGSGGYALGTQGNGVIRLDDTLAVSAGSSGAATSDSATVALSSQLTGSGGLVLSSLHSNDGSGTAVNGARGTVLRSTTANSFSGGIIVHSGYLGLYSHIGNAGSGTITLNASDSSNGGIGTNLILKTGGGTLANTLVLGNETATGGGNPRLGIALNDSIASDYILSEPVNGNLGSQTLRFSTNSSNSSLTLSGNGNLSSGGSGTLQLRSGRIILNHANAFTVGNSPGNGSSGGWQLGNFSNGSTGSAQLLTNGFNVGGRVTGNSATSSGNTSGDNVIVGGIHTSGTATFSGNVQIARIVGGTRQFHLTSAAGGTTVFSGVISDAATAGSAATVVPVRKSGAGTVKLTNANIYQGGATVSQGTLLADNATGSATGTGAVTVQNDAALGGTGSISGAVTIADGGKLSFALSTTPAAHDRLDFGGTLGFSGTAKVVISASGSAPTPGTYTLLRVAGTVLGALPSLELPSGWSGSLQWSGGDLQLIVPATTPLEAWRHTHWNAWQNTGDAANTADPDADGLVNLLEFVLGGNPKAMDDPAVSPSVANQGSDLIMSFKRTDASEQQSVTLRIQVSGDLATWLQENEIVIGATSGTGPGGATYTVEENGNAADNIVVIIPTGSAATKFARLVATD